MNKKDVKQLNGMLKDTVNGQLDGNCFSYIDNMLIIAKVEVLLQVCKEVKLGETEKLYDVIDKIINKLDPKEYKRE